MGKTKQILISVCVLALVMQLIYFAYFKETMNVAKHVKEDIEAENAKLKTVDNCPKTKAPPQPTKPSPVLPKTRPLYIVKRMKNHTFFYKEDITLNNSIFFVESSGRSDLLLKELCAMESAAKLNPEQMVYFIMTNRTAGKDESNYNELLAKYKNLKFAPIDLTNTFRGSVIEHLWFENKIQSSPYYYAHLSDIVRIMILHQYGGTYLDIDTIVLKHLTKDYNFAAMTPICIANGVMRFEAEHPVTKMILDNVASSYNPNNWDQNGPKLLTSMIYKLCNANTVDTINAANCHKLKILLNDAFYPINYLEWKLYYDPKSKKTVEERLKNTLIAHYWGSQTSKAKVKPGMPIHDIALQKCPIIAKKFK